MDIRSCDPPLSQSDELAEPNSPPLTGSCTHPCTPPHTPHGLWKSTRRSMKRGMRGESRRVRTETKLYSCKALSITIIQPVFLSQILPKKKIRKDGTHEARCLRRGLCLNCLIRGLQYSILGQKAVFGSRLQIYPKTVIGSSPQIYVRSTITKCTKLLLILSPTIILTSPTGRCIDV